jgi:hypothetical protein
MVTDAAWLALTGVLTVLGALWTVYAARRRGAPAAVRGAAITLLPSALLLTGTLRLGARVVDATVDWATGLVFNPFLWFGVGLAGLSALLFVISARMSARTSARASDRQPDAAPQARRRGQLPGSSGRGEPAIDDDLADIEALLKKRGIT